MRVIKNEIKRIIFSKEMMVAVLLASVIVIWHQITYVWNPGHEVIGSDGRIESVYYNWIGGNCAHFQSFFFFFVFPILAVIPSGGSYMTDRNSGYISQYTIRGAHKDYMIGKIIGTFFSGFFVVIFPLFLSFLLTAMKFPMINPESVMGLGPDAFSFDGEMYYHNPLIHTVLFILFDGIFSGGFALFSITACFLFSHRFAVLVTPFVIHYFLFSLDRIVNGNDLSPNYFLIPGFSPHLWWEYVVSIGVLVVNAILIYFISRKESRL
ncbi:MAG: hypothetical protein K6G63_00095 [Eubacterium sp.]|nr:hypothetical protein [Eubacterium sp.]